MSDQNPSIISHVSLGTNDFARATAFYDRVLAPFGCRRIVDLPNAVAYGKVYPELWVQVPHDGAPASVGNGVHFALFASSPEQVDAFHAAAIEAGATDDGAPGARPIYSPAYYGAFVRDLDGNKLEATFWDESKAE